MLARAAVAVPAGADFVVEGAVDFVLLGTEDGGEIVGHGASIEIERGGGWDRRMRSEVEVKGLWRRWRWSSRSFVIGLVFESRDIDNLCDVHRNTQSKVIFQNNKTYPTSAALARI